MKMATHNDSSTKELEEFVDDPPHAHKLELDEYSLLNFEIERLKEDCNKFSFLAVGRTGAGKSTLLNALTDTKVFKGSDDRRTAGTTSVSPYEFERNGVTVTAWDSPGFEDYSGNEEEYKEELRRNCSEVDLVLYCISLQDTRSVNLKGEDSSLNQITKALTGDVWDKSVIVLTYANTLERRFKNDGNPNVEAAFAQRIDIWKEEVQDALRHAGVDEVIVKQIQVVAAGHSKKKHLPGRQFWLSFLWIVLLAAVKNEHAKLALQKANEDRFVPEKDGENSSPTSLVMTKDHVAILAGSAVGMAGVAIGGTTGALIGALAIGIPTFGVAAGVGLVLGLFIGGAVGGGAGTGIGTIIKKIRDKRRKKKAGQSESESISDSCFEP